MNIVNIRSPYFITINETGQIGSKVELYIWNKGTTEPSTPNYTLSKSIPSSTQIENNYNISNFVKEFINNISPTTVSVPTAEDNNAWVNFKVKRYKLVGSTYTLLDTTSYIGVNGYNNYMNGYNQLVTGEYYPLKNQTQKIQYYNTNIPYLNLLINRNITYRYVVRYYNSAGGYFHGEEILAIGGSVELFNYKIPLVYQDSVKAAIVTEDSSQNIISTFGTYYTNKIEEYKYSPLVCSFINRYGGWEFLTFFKLQTNSISVKGTEYKLNQSSINYNPLIGQTQNFNINGSQNIKLNTGWVDENYSDLITDLLLSETILLDGKPVQLKTQSTDLKTSLKDKLINYEIEFSYSYNLLNDIV